MAPPEVLPAGQSRAAVSTGVEASARTLLALQSTPSSGVCRRREGKQLNQHQRSVLDWYSKAYCSVI